jgi:hypothetical protein
MSNALCDNALHHFVDSTAGTISTTLYPQVARFLRTGGRMKKLALALGVVLGACQTDRTPEPEDESTLEVPIGPGTDSSALASPDTPMSQAPHSSPRDTTPRPRNNR